MIKYKINYNPEFNLIIDPLVYSTYVGGSKDDSASDIASDNQGNALITGMTNSTDFPTTPGVYNTTYNGVRSKRDVYVFKLNNKGTGLLYSTYIGGSDGVDRGSEIEVDDFGNAYVMGDTQSSDFPVTQGAFDTCFNSTWDAFILKLNQNGSKLVYSTFIGGEGQEVCGDIEIDTVGNVYLTGFVNYHDFPITAGAYDRSFNGFWDCFLLKLNQKGSALIYSTFFGSPEWEHPSDLAIDSSGNTYVTGVTNSSNFPTTPNVYDRTYNGNGLGGETDVFVLKFNQAGSTLLYSTFIGGNKWDYGLGITLDNNNNAYVTGYTNSSDFHTTPGAYKENNSGMDAYVLKLNHNGSKLLYSTLVGGAGSDWGCDITLDSENNAFVSGGTSSLDYPTTSNAYDPSYNGNVDSIIFKLNSNASKLLYSTYIGGSEFEKSGGFEMDCLGNVYIVGTTNSSDFPTTPMAFDITYNGESGSPAIIRNDIFVTKMKLINVENEIISLALLKDNEPVTTVYANYSQYTFRINVTTEYSLTNLGLLDLILDSLGSDIELSWDRSTSVFSEVNDPFNYVTLNSSSSAQKVGLDQWTIYFNLTFNWNYPNDNFNDVQVQAMHIDLPTAWLNVSNYYRVENDLVFDGELLVKGTNNQIIEESGEVLCGEELNWSGLVPVYEGTTDVFPPESEFDISIWDETGNKWFDSPAPGEPFEIHNQAPVKPFPNGYKYIINISEIPPECDNTNESFNIKVDCLNLTFSNPIPNNKTWQTSLNVMVGVTITKFGIGYVNGTSVMCSVSTDNGKTWSDWESVSGLKTAKSVNAKTNVTLKEGKDNLIKWRAMDSLNNGPIQSEKYRILVDTKDVVFSDELPTETTVSESQNVTVGITISDITSGVRATTIEYTISNDEGITWSSWISVPGLEDGSSINVALNLIFPDGTGNLIKWRASDIADNGPKESKSYTIKINDTTSKLKVRLQNPRNGSIITEPSINLTWTLVNSNLSNIKYDIILDTVGIPTKIIKTNYTKTNLIVTNLTNGSIYYWQVIPKLGTKNGLCISGIWSFTINISHRVPFVLQIYPGDKEILPSNRPTLSWSLKYSGIENVVYDIHLDTNYPPKLIIEKHPYTNFTPSNELEDGKTYYWKVVPRVGDLNGPASEIWSFNIDSNYRPSLDFDLKIEPAIIELKPGESTNVKIIITNLAELQNNILFSIKEPANDTGIILILPNLNEIVLDPQELIEFNITVTADKDAKSGEVIFIVEAVSKSASNLGLDLKKNAQLTVRIINDDTEPGNLQNANYLWVIYIISIVIVILLVLIFIKIEKDKLLLNFQRKAIFDAIKMNPSIHFRELMRELSLKSGTLSYHINQLEKKGYIKSIQKGVYRCFYASGTKTDFKIIISTIQQRMLIDINENPGISLSELSQSLGKNKYILYYHANILEDAEMIIKEKRGRISTFYITPKAAFYLS